MSRGSNVFGKILPQLAQQSNIPVGIRDLFLHALFARLALSDNRVIEFETKYNCNTNTIELQIPSDVLPLFDEMMGMQRGPKFQAFIDWLVGKQQIISDVPTVVLGFDNDQQFVPVGSLTIWTGATIESSDTSVVIALPTSILSVIGYNTKLSESISGNNLKVSLVWRYDAGNSTSYDIRTTLTSTDFDGVVNVSESADVNISTFNLINGDIRTTELINVFDVEPEDLLNIVIQRNFEGSGDLQTESVNVIGLKVEIS